MPEGSARWLFLLQSWSQIWSPSRVSFGSSAFYPAHHSTDQHDLWTRYPSPALCWWQPAVCSLCIRGLYCGTEWYTSHVWTSQSWMLMKTLKLNPDKTEFLLIGNKWQRSKYLAMFPFELFSGKTNPTKSWNLVVIFDSIQQSAAHAFTISGICCVFAISLIWIVQNYLQLLLRRVISFFAIHFCMVPQTLTSSNFTLTSKLQSVQNRLAHVTTKSPPFTRSVSLIFSLHWLPVKLYCSRSVYWLTKRIMKNRLFIFTPCLPHHSHPFHWDQTKELVCQSVGSRTTQAQEFFTPPSLQNNLPLSVHSAISFTTF